MAVLYLIYRTFVALDIYRGSGGHELHANAIEAFSAKPRARGRPSRRHHKSIHAKINHFHWTPSMREGGRRGVRGWRELDDARSRGVGAGWGGRARRWRDGRFRERSVNIQEIPGG